MHTIEKKSRCLFFVSLLSSYLLCQALWGYRRQRYKVQTLVETDKRQVHEQR